MRSITPAERVLFAACAVLFLSIGTRQGFGLLMAPTMGDPGLTREQFALSVATQYLVWGVAGPLSGLLADRFGARKTVAAGGLFYVAGLAAAAHARSFEAFWLTAGLLVGIGIGGASFGVVHACVAKAYPPDKRGLALGIVGAATAAGQLSMLMFTEWTVQNHGWRRALVLHALCVAPIVIASAFLRVRESGSAGAANEHPGVGLRTALRQPQFWLIALPFSFSGFQVMSTMTHLPAMVTDAGLGSGDALVALAAVSGSAFFGQLLFGRLADRWSKSAVLALVYAIRAALSMVAAAVPFTSATIGPFFCLIGLVWMSPIPLASSLTAMAFGTARLASIFSVAFFFHQAGGFVGTWLAAVMREHTGTYGVMWCLGGALCLAGAVASAAVEHLHARTAEPA